MGRTLNLDGQPYTIIGVMPETFEMVPADVQAFRPTNFAADQDRATHNYMVLGRLRPGATLTQANAEVSSAFRRLAAEFPDANSNWTVLVQPARSFFPGPTDTRLVLLLLVVALFGVAIACANVANLMLARAELRLKEMAVRTALGARRGRLLAQLLTESVLLSLMAGALGTVFATYAIRGLRASMPPVLPHSFWPRLDIPTMLATTLVAMLTGILFGLAPALHATRSGLREAMGDNSRGGTASRNRKRIRNAFVIGEIAIALGLLTGAGFLMKAMDTVINADPGFNPHGLLTLQMTLPEYRYRNDSELGRFQDEAVRRLTGIPGVSGVALMSMLPRSMSNSRTTFHIAGTPVVEANKLPGSYWETVNPDFFPTLGIPLEAGRLFNASDRADSRPVIVVSRGFANRWLTGGPALGQRIEVFGVEREVVGIVGDIMQTRVPLGPEDKTAIYIAAAQRPPRNPAFALRVSGDPATLAAQVRSAIAQIDPDEPVADIRTLDDHISEALGGPRAIGVFVLALGTLAMVLAAIGIYGVMAHSVVQAKREIGIRVALGARQGQVVGMVARRGMVLAGVGLLLGLPIAILVHRAVVSSLNIFAINLSPAYALIMAGMLVTVAVFASWLPARRAARIQPVQALQAE